MKIRYLGHSAFLLEGSRRVLIDPFLRGNPAAPVGPGDVEADYIVVTHLHGDHFGDAVEIAKRTGATIVAIFEVANLAQRKGVRAVGGNIGGYMHLEGVDIALTNAVHSGWGEGIYAQPVGAVIRMDGHVVYHAGDTGLFYDMKLIGDIFRPEVALLPIGGWFTMDVRQAVEAVKLIRPRLAVPMHYNTFDVIRADPEEFKRLVEEETETRVRILRPGESLEI